MNILRVSKAGRAEQDEGLTLQALGVRLQRADGMVTVIRNES